MPNWPFTGNNSGEICQLQNAQPDRVSRKVRQRPSVCYRMTSDCSDDLIFFRKKLIDMLVKVNVCPKEATMFADKIFRLFARCKGQGSRKGKKSTLKFQLYLLKIKGMKIDSKNTQQIRIIMRQSLHIWQ